MLFGRCWILDGGPSYNKIIKSNATRIWNNHRPDRKIIRLDDCGGGKSPFDLFGIYCSASSDIVAREIEQHFLDKGMDGGSGGGVKMQKLCMPIKRQRQPISKKWRLKCQKILGQEINIRDQVVAFI